MKDYSTQGGSWKECPQCGKTFFCSGPEWAYKRAVSEGGLSTLRYFDRYSCLRAFDKEYEEKKRKRRIESARLQHKRKKQMKGKTS